MNSLLPSFLIIMSSCYRSFWWVRLAPAGNSFSCGEVHTQFVHSTFYVDTRKSNCWFMKPFLLITWTTQIHLRWCLMTNIIDTTISTDKTMRITYRTCTTEYLIEFHLVLQTDTRTVRALKLLNTPFSLFETRQKREQNVLSGSVPFVFKGHLRVVFSPLDTIWASKRNSSIIAG